MNDTLSFLKRVDIRVGHSHMCLHLDVEKIISIESLIVLFNNNMYLKI